MYKSIGNLNLISKFITLYFIHNTICIERPIGPEFLGNLMIIQEHSDWQLNNLKNFNFQQIPGIAFNNSQLSIFHRSTVVWNEKSFDENTNIYNHQNQSIIVDPILTFDLSGNFISSWGKNHFFMPHGLSFDPNGNVWLTDVALHQVFRFNKKNLTAPDLILGERFIPGNDKNHFCKPTDVQVSEKVEFIYISDGYCNSRIVVFNKNGEFVNETNFNQQVEIPHSLSIIEELDLICVADRGHSRVLCLNAGIKDQSKFGAFKKELQAPLNLFNAGLYAIQNIGTYLFALEAYSHQKSARGLIFDLTQETNELVWQDDLPLILPHDCTIDDNHNLYISEIMKNTKLVKKFSYKNLKSNQNLFKMQSKNSSDLKIKSKRIYGLSNSDQEEDLKKWATTSLKMKDNNSTDHESSTNNIYTTKSKSKHLFFLLIICAFIFFSVIIFFLKKRTHIENYFPSYNLPFRLIYSRDRHINDPERLGFNLLKEEEENLFDFELENNSSESEVEEFNFKHVRKV